MSHLWTLYFFVYCNNRDNVKKQITCVQCWITSSRRKRSNIFPYCYICPLSCCSVCDMFIMLLSVVAFRAYHLTFFLCLILIWYTSRGLWRGVFRGVKESEYISTSLKSSPTRAEYSLFLCMFHSNIISSRCQNPIDNGLCLWINMCTSSQGFITDYV